MRGRDSKTIARMRAFKIWTVIPFPVDRSNSQTTIIKHGRIQWVHQQGIALLLVLVVVVDGGAAPQPFIQSSCGFSAPPARLTTQQTTTMYLVPRPEILATQLPVYFYPGTV